MALTRKERQYHQDEIIEIMKRRPATEDGFTWENIKELDVTELYELGSHLTIDQYLADMVKDEYNRRIEEEDKTKEAQAKEEVQQGQLFIGVEGAKEYDRLNNERWEARQQATRKEGRDDCPICVELKQIEQLGRNA